MIIWISSYVFVGPIRIKMKIVRQFQCRSSIRNSIEILSSFRDATWHTNYTFMLMCFVKSKLPSAHTILPSESPSFILAQIDCLIVGSIWPCQTLVSNQPPNSKMSHFLSEHWPHCGSHEIILRNPPLYEYSVCAHLPQSCGIFI